MRFTIIISLLLALSSPLRSEEKKEVPAEYGQSSAQTIAVRAEGEMEKPGIYHVRAGTTFSEFIGQAGRSRLSNGRFAITRTIQGKKESIQIRYDRQKKEFTPNLELLDGDLIYAAFYMAKRRPIQSITDKPAISEARHNWGSGGGGK